MPSSLSWADELADLGRLGRPEGRRRLVHDQDPGVEVDRPGDGHRLALATRQRLDRGLEVPEPRVEAAHDLAGRGLHRGVVERPEARGQLAAEEQVGRRVHVVRQRERLVDRLDPQGLRVARVVDRDLLAVDEDLAGIGDVGTGQDPHQGRLAGAVAADQADDLAGVEVHVHPVHGMDAAERDADVAHLDERRRPDGGAAGRATTGRWMTRDRRLWRQGLRRPGSASAIRASQLGAGGRCRDRPPSRARCRR